ncbi:uncharacterized protein [Amphiura filiformis]|uniref:uncharacterized protein n=1 Tax=Amphiura filiformis TaxID=82378 RepID=UPI003B223482
MCEGAVYRVLSNQDQQLKMKLIGKWLQQSKPNPLAPIPVFHPVPFHILLLRLISVLSSAMCLMIDLHQRNIIDVKGRLLLFLTDLPPIGQHRSSFVLSGLVCVIIAVFLAGKNRLRYIDAISPFTWLLSLTINWTPHIPQCITQLPWLQKLGNWLPWEICWHLGVSICCAVCSLVFLFSSREVVKKRKFKRSESLSGNLRSASCDSSAGSSVVSDEPPYQPQYNDVSMVSDHMTSPTNHDRHELGASLNTLSLGPPTEQKKKKKGDIWTNYTNPDSSKSSSGYISNDPTNPHLTSSSSSMVSVTLRAFSSFCIIVLRCLTVLSAISCLVIDLHQNSIVDVKKMMMIFVTDVPSICRHRPEIALCGLICVMMAAGIAWRKKLTHKGTIGIILWLFIFDWSPPWLSKLHIQSPWLQHTNNWLPWRLCWQLGVSICCVVYSGMLLVFNSKNIARKTLQISESFTDFQNTNDDNASAVSSASSESSHHLYGNDVSMVSDHVTQQQATNHDRPVLADCLNTMSLGQPADNRKKGTDLWTTSTSFSPSQPLTSHHRRRPIIQPAKLQLTPRSKFAICQKQQGFMSSGKDYTKYSKWHDS